MSATTYKQSFIKSYFKLHPIIGVLLLFFIFATIILVIIALNIKSTSEVELLVAPASATVTIDGKTYKNGTYKLPARELFVHIEKPGFISQDFTFNAQTDHKLYAYLIQEDGKYSWYNEHEDDALILNTIGDYRASLSSESYNNQNPIIMDLPIIYANYDENYHYTEYRIDGGNFADCQTDFCLKITDTTSGNYDHALESLQSAGYDPSNYQILYEYTPIVPLE